MPTVTRLGYYNSVFDRYWPGTDVPKLAQTSFWTYVPVVITEKYVAPTRTSNPPDKTGWRNPAPYSLERKYVVTYQGSAEKWTIVGPYDQRMTISGFVRHSPDIPPYEPPVPVVPSNWRNRAEVECLVKLKEQNVNYALALAEAQRSVSLIGGAFTSVFEAYRHARKGRWQSATQALGIPRHSFKAGSKDVSGRWLELQYGWLPLLSDVHNAYEDSRQGLLRHGTRISATRTIKSEPTDFTTKSAAGVVINHKWLPRKDVFGVKVRLDYSIDSQALALASKVGLTNPAVIGWELVPFSFVVDWAVPIGNWLSAFDATTGLSFLGGTHTTFVRVNLTSTCKMSAPRPSSGSRWGNCNFTGSMSYFKMARAVYTSAPIPTPYWKNPISTGHALNALALLRQLLK